jgi:hypothetical protein
LFWRVVQLRPTTIIACRVHSNGLAFACPVEARPPFYDLDRVNSYALYASK